MGMSDMYSRILRLAPAFFISLLERSVGMVIIYRYTLLLSRIASGDFFKKEMHNYRMTFCIAIDYAVIE